MTRAFSWGQTVRELSPRAKSPPLTRPNYPPAVFHEVGYPANHFVTQGLKAKAEPSSISKQRRSQWKVRS